MRICCSRSMRSLMSSVSMSSWNSSTIVYWRSHISPVMVSTMAEASSRLTLFVVISRLNSLKYVWTKNRSFASSSMLMLSGCSNSLDTLHA